MVPATLLPTDAPAPDQPSSVTTASEELPTSGGFSRRMIRGGIATAAVRVGAYLGSTIRLFVLARLLAPEDFGLVGIGLLAISTLDVLTEGGISTALIQRAGDISRYYSTVYLVQAVRGILAGVAVFLAAPLLADFFRTPASADVFRTLAVISVIRGFTNPALVELNRSFAFGRLALLSLVEIAAGLAVAVPIALATHDVRALLASLIVAQFARTVGSFVVARPFPRAPLDWPGYVGLFAYSKWIYGTNMLVFVLLHVDDLVVAVILGPAALGLYQVAYRTASLIAVETTLAISQVAFPAYAALQNQAPRQERGLGRVLLVTVLFAAPTTVLLIYAGPDLFRVLLGARWTGAGLVFQLLCAYAFARAVTATLATFLQAIGRPEATTVIAALQLIVVGAAIVPAVNSAGIEGAALLVLAANGAALGVAIAYILRSSRAAGRTIADAFWPGVRVALVLAGVLTAAALFLRPNADFVLPLYLGLAAAVSPLAIVPLWRELRPARPAVA